MPESESSRGGKRIRAGPFAYVSDGLHKVDLLLSSTHQVLLQRLKEGGIAIEQRRGKLFREGPQKRRETRSEQITTSAGPRRGFRRLSLPRDAEYAASEPRNVSAEMNGPSPSGRNGGVRSLLPLFQPYSRSFNCCRNTTLVSARTIRANAISPKSLANTNHPRRRCRRWDPWRSRCRTSRPSSRRRRRGAASLFSAPSAHGSKRWRTARRTGRCWR